MAAHTRPTYTVRTPGRHRRPAPPRGCVTGKRMVALTVTGTMSASAAVLAAGTSAAAATTPVSQAEGRFLGGEALGTALSLLLDVAPARAKNTGGSVVTQANPLSVSALNSVNIDVGPVNLLGDNGILELGAVGQFARARPDGSSVAASGAVTSSGAIGVGGTSGVPKADATLDLGNLLDDLAPDVVSDLELRVGALSARATQAKGKNGAQSGTYKIAGLSLELRSPALADVLDTLTTTLDGLQGTLNGLDETLEGLLVVPIVDVTGIPDLTDVVDDLGTVQNANGGLKVDLKDGSVTVDVAKVLAAAGLNLNSLPANTNLLPYVLDALTDELPGLVTAALEDLADDLEDALGDIEATVLGVPIAAGVLTGAVDDLLEPILGAVDDAVSGLDAGLDNDIADVLSDVLGLTANVKSTSGNEFTQRALRLRLLPSADPDAAVVNLASASVGPNAGPGKLPPPVITHPVYGSETEDTTPPIAGRGKPGLKVVVVEDGDRICSAKVKADETWLCVPEDEMALGRHTITATQSSATQKSGRSAPDVFTIVEVDDPDTDPLPETGATGTAVPTAAAGLLLLLGGAGLTAAPTLTSAGSGRHRAGRGNIPSRQAAGALSVRACWLT